MSAIVGLYKNGRVSLDRDYPSNNPVKVLVTFLDGDQTERTKKRLSLTDFSFTKSQENLKDYNGCLSDEVVSERRLSL